MYKNVKDVKCNGMKCSKNHVNLKDVNKTLAHQNTL